MSSLAPEPRRRTLAVSRCRPSEIEHDLRAGLRTLHTKEGRNSMRRATTRLLGAFASAVILGAGALPACSGSSSSAGGAGSAGVGDGAGAAEVAGTAGVAGVAGAAAGAAGAMVGSGGSGGAQAACAGTAPTCRGTDLSQCCGQDPYGVATCQNGMWMCSLFSATPVPAPGCNGQSCFLQGTAGTAGTAGTGGQSSAGNAGTGGTGGSTAACSGSAPNCFGSDSSKCCGKDPAGQATCKNGAWLCFGAPAPGCNGQSCI